MRRPPPAAPPDAEARRAISPVPCYPPEGLAPVDLPALRRALEGARAVSATIVPPREGRCFRVRAGQFFRISCPEGPQVGDLNLWNGSDLSERFYSGKSRALHGTHLGVGSRMWSGFPFLRPMATIVADSLAWYGADPHGCRVHDVIGTRCDPYTNRLLNGTDYHHCCHSNLTRALADETGLPLNEAEAHVHDVLNVFMCTGFDRETGRYIMKASPAREGDSLTLFAEIDLLGALSACPGGDCAATHSSDAARCFPLMVEILAPAAPPEGWRPPAPSGYDRSHGR